MNKILKIVIYQKLNLKKHTKQTRKTETKSWIQRVLMVARWDGRCGGMDKDVRGLRSTNR